MSKILKNTKLSQISLIVPELSPQQQECFKSVIEELIHNLEKRDPQTDLENLKKTVIENGFKQGYQEGFNLGKTEGFEKGFEEGYKEGLKTGEKKAKENLLSLEEGLKKEYRSKLEKLDKLLKLLEEEKKKLVLNLDREVLSLALLIAKKLVLKEVKTDETLTLNLIREALNYLAEGIEIKIKVNPEEMNYLEKEILKELKSSSKVIFESDPNVTKGGVFIETSLGVIDATLEKRWEKLLDTLFNHES